MAKLIKLMSISTKFLDILCEVIHKYGVSEFFRVPGRRNGTMDSQCARNTHVDSSFQPWNYSQDQTREFVFANARSQSSGSPEPIPLRVSKLAFEKQNKQKSEAQMVMGHIMMPASG